MSFSERGLHVRRFPTAVLAVILVLGACTDDGPTQGGDTTAPTVSTESPAAGATNVDVSAVVSVAFSEPMNAATITTSTFTLTGPGGGVTGAVALTGNTATFTPAAPLAYLTEYTALVTTGVTDLAGNALAANHAWTFTTGQAELLKVIGDIEGQNEFCAPPTTLATANSIHVGARVLGTETRTFANLLDVTGSVTPIAFVFDVGGGGVGNVFCNRPGDALETDGITENGPVLHKPWHIEGLTPGGSYTLTFTGGGVGAPRRSMRVFVDVDGNGTIEPGEVEDLIGLDGVVETRTFGQTITADENGVIIGEYWGGSTNGAGENGAWRGWSIKGF